jgi:hypothetical protein
LAATVPRLCEANAGEVDVRVPLAAVVEFDPVSRHVGAVAGRSSVRPTATGRTARNSVLLYPAQDSETVLCARMKSTKARNGLGICRRLG